MLVCVCVCTFVCMYIAINGKSAADNALLCTHFFFFLDLRARGTALMRKDPHFTIIHCSEATNHHYCHHHGVTLLVG